MKKIWDYLWERLVRYALKFGVVGLGGYLIDLGLSNLLWSGALGDGWYETPLGGKFVSVAVSTLATWFGNRYWTFRDHRRKNFVLELAEFTLIAVIGLGISLACLYISHYALGLTSIVADNVSGNVIGLALATAFRFLLYRYWVFAPTRADGHTALKARAAAAEAETDAQRSGDPRVSSL